VQTWLWKLRSLETAGPRPALCSGGIRWRIALCLLGAFLAPATQAAAQHAMNSDLAALGCAVCHSNHAGGSAAFNLLVVPVPGFEAQVPELGQSSKSCLRCHGDGTVPGDPASSMGRPFRLGPSLADDHPLGSGRPNVGFGVPGTSLEAIDAELSAGLGFDTGGFVECSACHDPHDRSGDPIRTAGEAATCARCHDVTARDIQSHRTLECSGCHRLHEGAGRLLTDDRLDRVCGYCHLPGYPAPARIADPVGRASQSGILAPMDETHTKNLNGGCIQCHPVH